MTQQTQPNATELPRFERPSEAVVYWTLLDLCEGTGGLFQVSLRRLARHCGLSVSTTNRAALTLTKRGLIRYRPGQNQARPSCFELRTARGANVSRPRTAVPEIGTPTPTDSDPDLCRDTYLDDHDPGAVHRESEYSAQPKELARAIAEALGDMANLALYESYCRRYPLRVVMRALQEARAPAPEKIRVSRGALFNHLCQRYGAIPKYNSHSRGQAR